MSPLAILRTLSLAGLVAALVACGTPASVPPLPETAEAAPAPVEAAAPVETPRAPAAPTTTGTVPAPAPAPPTQARPSAAPVAPVPPPEPVTVVVPAGTKIDVAFLDSVSSAESQPGDPVRVRVMSDIMQDDIAAIPAGSVVAGTVTEAKSLKKIGGKARVGLEFTTLELTSGRRASIRTTFALAGKSETKKDAATIGGATAGGALLGRMIEKDDKSKGTLIGAVVGAAAGTAIAAKTEGEEVVITSGTQVSLELLEPATISIIP